MHLVTRLHVKLCSLDVLGAMSISWVLLHNKIWPKAGGHTGISGRMSSKVNISQSAAQRMHRMPNAHVAEEYLA
jgi:hypothetical protein